MMFEEIESRLKVKISVQNIVATAKFDPVDLEDLHRRHQQCTVYDYWSFPALRYKGNDFTALVANSGKVTILGLKSIQHIEKAVQQLEEVLGQKCKEVKVRNIVALVDLGETIDIDRFARERGVIYDPSIFSGAFGRKFTVFASGKVIVRLTPETAEQELTAIVNKLRSL